LQTPAPWAGGLVKQAAASLQPLLDVSLGTAGGDRSSPSFPFLLPSLLGAGVALLVVPRVLREEKRAKREWALAKGGGGKVG